MREFIRICGVVSVLALASCSGSPAYAQECVDKDLAVARLEAAGVTVLGEAPARFSKSRFLFVETNGHLLAFPVVNDCVVVDMIDLGTYVPEVGA